MHCLWMYRDRRNSDGVGRIIHIANDHGGTTNKVFLQGSGDPAEFNAGVSEPKKRT